MDKILRELYTGALFVNERGSRLNRDGIYGLVAKCAQAVGLHHPDSEDLEDHFTPRCCRHLVRYLVARRGMDRKFIRELQRHRRKDSMSVYDHIDRDKLRRAYTSLSSLR